MFSMTAMSGIQKIEEWAVEEFLSFLKGPCFFHEYLVCFSAQYIFFAVLKAIFLFDGSAMRFVVIEKERKEWRVGGVL
jgi:hypothetical protein